MTRKFRIPRVALRAFIVLIVLLQQAAQAQEVNSVETEYVAQEAGAAAVESDIRKWTLQECIDYAIENNIEIRQQALVAEGAEIDLNTTQHSLLPNLNAGLNQNFNFGRSPSATTGIYEANQAASSGISAFSQTPLFAGMKIKHQIEAGRLNLQAATEGLLRAKENLELQVVALYLEVLFKKKIRLIHWQQMEKSAYMLECTQIMVEAGKVPRSQLFEIQAQLAKDELNYTVSISQVHLSLLNLAQSLNLQQVGEFDVVEPSTGELSFTIWQSPDEIYLSALDQRPHVHEAELQLKNSLSQMRVAQSAFWPTINLSLSYNTGYDHIFNNSFTNASFAKQLSTNHRQSIGASMSIPIFSRNMTRNSVRQARLQIENRELELEKVKLQIYKEIQLSYQNALAAEAKFAASMKASETAREAAWYARERYMGGLSTVYEYSESEAKWLQAVEEQIQAEYEFLFRTQILNYYQGIPINIE